MNDHSGGSLNVVREAIRSFNDARASEAAASMAYYTIFSLFPLLLALVAAGSFFLQREWVYREVVRSVTEAIPVSQELIESNIQQVLEQREAVGVVGLAGLFWAGTGVFTVLARHINRAWTGAERRGLLERRLVAVGMVGMLAALLLLSLLSTHLLTLLPRLSLPLWEGVSIYGTPLWAILSSLLPGLVTFLIFLGLYRWVPNTQTRWSEAFWGALVVACAWEIAKGAFTWYLSSELAQYQLVYGSLGAVVALMLWIYLSSWLALFGAHLSAAVARCR
jgi:membrane protein